MAFKSSISQTSSGGVTTINGESGAITITGSGGIAITTPSAQVVNVDGSAISSGVSSVSNSDGSLTISPTTGAVVASLNPAHSNTFTADQSVQNANLQSLKGNLKFTSETAPGAPTIALVTTGTGNCTNGAHRVKITFITAQGETEAGTQSASVTVDNTHKQISLSAIPLGTSSIVTGRNVYMMKAGGTTFFRLGSSPTINNNTATTLTINIADGSLNAATSPANNTTGGNIYSGGVRRMLLDSATGNLLLTTNLTQFLNSVGAIIAQVDCVNNILFSSGFTSDLNGGTGGEYFGRFSTAGANGFAGGFNAAAGINGVSVGAQTFGATGTVAIGKFAQGNNNAVAIGDQPSASGDSAIAIGFFASAADDRTLAIGPNAQAPGGFPDTAILNYHDLYIGNVYDTALSRSLRAPNVFPGNPNTPAGDIYIRPGVGTGSGKGGDFKVITAPGGASGSSPNSTIDAVVTTDKGVTTLTSIETTISTPASGTGAILYSDGSFTTGYTTDGTTSRDYHIYAHNPAGGGIWSLAGTIANAPFVDDNSTTDIASTYPTGASASDIYVTGGSVSGQYPAIGTVRDYQIYAGCYLNGNLVFNATTYATATATDSSALVTVFPPNSSSSTENSGVTGYLLGDVVDYQIFSKCNFNSVTIFSSFQSSTSTTIASVLAGIDLSWTNTSFPLGSSAQGVRILRQVNGGGYNDYLDIADPTTFLTDDNTLWTSGSTVTPTDTPDLYEVDIPWSAAAFPSGGAAPFYRILRQVDGGGFNQYVDVSDPTTVLNDIGNGMWLNGNTISPTTVQNFYQIPMSWSVVSGADAYKVIRTISTVDTATDLGNVTSFTDTGTLAWADSTTVTPTSVPGYITTLCGSGSAINAVDTNGACGIPVFANNAAAIAGGLAIGNFYRGGGDPDPIYIVH